jgi:photosystem II stability/assembly factor-like uncharacterized protein
MNKIFLIMILLTATVVNAQWAQKSNGIFGGTVLSVASSGNKILAGTSKLHGVYLSTDYGENWRQFVANFDSVLSVAICGNNYIAGTDRGIYVSTNNGNNWSLKFSGGEFTTLFVTGDTVYTAKWGEISISTNCGLNWVQLPAPNQLIYSIIKIGNIIFLGTWNGVFYSTNNGQNWINTLANESEIKSLAVMGNNIFASAYNHGVYVSTNNGVNWTLTSLNTPYVIPLAVMGNNIFAGKDDGVYISTNNGVNWNVTNLSSNNIYALSSDGSNIFAGCSKKGIFKSTDNGQSWSQMLNAVSVRSFTMNNNNIYCGTEKGVYFSENFGERWIQTSLTNFTNSIESFNNVIFAGSNSNIGESGVINISNDNGLTWTQTLDVNDLVFISFINKNNTIYAGYYSPGGIYAGGIYKSIDNGQNWSFLTYLNGQLYSLSVFGNYLLAGTNTGIYISSDDGQNWLQTYSSGLGVSSFAVNGTNIYAGIRGGTGIIKSTNSGLNWFGTSFTNAAVYSISALNNVIFAATSGGVYISKDNGDSWINKNEGLENTWTRSLFTTNTYIFAGLEWNAIFRRDINNIVGINNNIQNIPSGFSLSQNYPNPFNPTTKINFALPKSGFVTLKIYDMLGREIKTLLNELLKPGTYETTFDASALSSGIYFYTLSAGNYKETKRMTLIR